MDLQNGMMRVSKWTYKWRDERAPNVLTKWHDEGAPNGLTKWRDEKVPNGLTKWRDEEVPNGLTKWRDEEVPNGLTKWRDEEVPNGHTKCSVLDYQASFCTVLQKNNSKHQNLNTATYLYGVAGIGNAI